MVAPWKALIERLGSGYAAEPAFKPWLYLRQKLITLSNALLVGKKNVSWFPFINGSQDFIGCLNTHMQLIMKKKSFYCISYEEALSNDALHN